MLPAKKVETSPAATPTIDSSSSARPSGTRPPYSSNRPCAGQPHRDQVRVLVAVPVPVICDGELVGGVEVAGGDVPVHHVDEQVPALDHVAVELVEQPLRPGDPAAADRRLAAGEQHRGEPERAAHRGRYVTGVEVELVGALQSLHAVVAPAERGRPRWRAGRSRSGELVRGGDGQPVVGRQPLAPVVSLPGPDQLLDYAHRAPPSNSVGVPGQAATWFTGAERATIWRAT